VQISTQYIYFVRDEGVGNDQPNDDSIYESNDPCLQNPCKNYGTCSRAFLNSFACFCLPSYTG
jgi:hypothetical protein